VTQRLAERAARALAPRLGRRSFLTKSAIVGSALAAAPAKYILEPGTAYAAVCSCAGSRCDCGAACCDGYTELCCAITGQNRCPTGTLTGGWWKVDGSSFCGGGARYYVDCNAQCGSCTCGGSGICPGSCSGTGCGCARGSCANRRAGCNGFRYGQCHQDVRCIGPIVCRVVSCVPPWQTDGSCGTTVRVDNATRNHHRPCLTGSPFGSFDAASPVSGGVRVRGWAIDPDTTSPIRVHVYVDGVGRASVLADRSRPDIGPVYPGSGSNHGFDVEVKDVAPGRRSVCVYAINNVAPGSNTGLGCRTATVSANPFANVEVAAVQLGRLRVAGWAIDPNTDSPIRVHVYANGRGLASLAADLDRPDVGTRFGRGTRHGFDARLPISPGAHQIDIYAINVGTGTNVRIARRAVTWNGDPFGHLDAVTPVGDGQVRVTGWAIDGEATAPIRVHIYRDGLGVASIAADLERADLAPLGHGTAHGFDATVTVGVGSHQVCTYAINVGAGSNVRFGCLRATVA
jgi:hypothetical protein